MVTESAAIAAQTAATTLGVWIAVLALKAMNKWHPRRRRSDVAWLRRNRGRIGR